ncbi:MAG: AAA family ATPase [Bryobacterales bacterium]
MLTRLKVSGFKNLVDVDVRFGPFTCVAGPNGVGKSNLFDAIRFLSALSEQPLMDAALSVRDEGGRTGDVRSLFHRAGEDYDDVMSFEAEMIVPTDGVDDLGQEAKARTTFLVYSLTLAYRKDNGPKSVGSLELKREDLSHIKLGEAYGHLGFPHSPAWRKSAVTGERRATPFISTDNGGGSRIIKIHQDGGSAGKPRSLLATNLPRTALSASNAAESPTATLAKREMQSWRLLQLEPSALREPDTFNAPVRLGSSGAHLAATLYHLAKTERFSKTWELDPDWRESMVLTRAANRLSQLIDDVRDVWIDRDERRELLTLYVTDKYGTSHPARALSGGTLRFLALTILELDPETSGVLCLEEPENGIHPERIPAMLELLQDIAIDVSEPRDPENPLRQVIINTHSPAVVTQVPDDSLLMAELREVVAGPRRFSRLSFSCLSDTWRAVHDEENITSRGPLLAYLNPTITADQEGEGQGPKSRLPQARGKRRVVDRPDVQMLLPFRELA